MASAPCIAQISCASHCDPSSNRLKWPSMYGWKMRPRLSVSGAVVSAKAMQ
jgi:hypothetical protein